MLRFLLDKFRQAPGPLKQTRLIVGDLAEEIIDLASYYVYRKKIGEEKYKKLNETPLAKETYIDKEVDLDQEYDYAVTAVDNSVKRNESPLSEEIRIKYIY